MALRRALAVTLVALMALPVSAPAAELGPLRGTVTSVDGSGVSGVALEVVSLDSGKSTRLRTDMAGAFEARLDPAPYKLELQGSHVVVRGPRAVSLVAGNTTPADLVVAQTAAATGSDAAGAAGTPNRKGDVVALVAFSAALAGAAIYAATRNREDRRPPTTSGSR